MEVLVGSAVIIIALYTFYTLSLRKRVSEIEMFLDIVYEWIEGLEVVEVQDEK